MSFKVVGTINIKLLLSVISHWQILNFRATLYYLRPIKLNNMKLSFIYFSTFRIEFFSLRISSTCINVAQKTLNNKISKNITYVSFSLKKNT